MFSLNTNIASLQAQNYLRTSSNFQSQTINQVTSGLRIVNSGDDAAGLAIANGLRSDQAVLSQGIRNANDGLSTLQTVDGGINNISQLLDRASTLATQSSSATFTGDRSVLNSEFQSVLTEINRQAQTIGLNNGGDFAKSLSVFIGGGRSGSNTTAITNGSIGVDLTHATVDTQSLGLSGYSVTGGMKTDASGNYVPSGFDIGTGAGTTSVKNILTDSSNVASEAQTGYTVFNFSGPGFTSTNGSNRVSVAVNLSSVTDVNSLATAINQAIQNAGNVSTQQATAFKNANIQASITTDSAGASHLTFTSSTSAFQVEAGDATANALIGNVSAGTAHGLAVGVATTAAAAQLAVPGGGTGGGAESVTLQIADGAYAGNGTAGTAGGAQQVTVSLAAGDTTAAAVLSKVNTALNGTGVTASYDSNSKLVFTSGNGTSLQVQAYGDTKNYLGLGTFGAAATNFTEGTAAAAGTQNVQIAIGNQVVSFAGLATSATESTNLSTLNTALQGNALTAAAGLVAVDAAGSIKIQSTNGTNFSLNTYGAADGGHVGFGFTAVDTGYVNSDLTGTGSNALTATAAAGVNASGSNAPSLDANGTSTSGFLNFNAMSLGNVSQTVTLTAPDASGTSHSISFSLSSSNAGTIDQALSTINTQLLQSNDSTLQNVVAVKEQRNGADGLRFVSSLANFNLALGTTATGTLNALTTQGITTSADQAQGAGKQGGAVIASKELNTGSTADISSETNAANAVTALSNATTALGRAQAAVGKGENLFNYAINLAQSQVTNEAASESRIRDADLAAEAANLSKAQILVQAGTAALAQANSAPQAILTLLRG